MARYSPAALLALLSVSSTGSGGSGSSGGGDISVSVSAYIAPTNFQNSQRRNRRDVTFSLAMARSGVGTSSTFRPLFDDDGRTAPVDGDRSRRIPQTGSTGGAVSVDQSAAAVNRLRPDSPNRAAPEPQQQRRPNTRNARDVPAKKKGPLWGMFPGSSNNDNNGGGDMGSSGSGGRVRLSDLGKDADDAGRQRSSSSSNNVDGANENAAGSGKKKGWGGRDAGSGGGRRPGGGGGGGEPTLFDKVSNFVADSGTIAVLKVSFWFGMDIMEYTHVAATAYILES